MATGDLGRRRSAPLGRDIDPTSRASVIATAQRLGVIIGIPGVFLVRTVPSGTDLFRPYEYMIVDIAGPRTGKTTARAVPAIADAPGAVIVTSNKRDMLDATRGLREDDDQVATCLGSSRVAPWVNPGTTLRPEFNPHQFVRRGGTLDSLSREGAGNAGPLVTALTAAAVKAAEDYATTCPGGRLPVPMIGVLDEAANVCRWKDLPDLYSHYGSRGIVLITILQSCAQGVDCGVNATWRNSGPPPTAASTAAASPTQPSSTGSANSSATGNCCGLRHRPAKHGTSVNRQLQREQILDVAELAPPPAGRAIVFSSGSRATLIRSIPWMDRPYADRIRASLARFDPGARAASHPIAAPTPEAT